MARKSIKGDVAHCEYHTREDERTGKEIRIGACTGFCRIMEETRGGFTLTSFLVKLMGYDDADVLKADAAKAAKLYGINPAHAAGYIAMEIERRGIRGGVGNGNPVRKSAGRKRGKVAAGAGEGVAA